MTVKLLTEHHLERLSFKGGCTGSSESTLVKMPHCWKSHVTAQLFSLFQLLFSLFALIFVTWPNGQLLFFCYIDIWVSSYFVSKSQYRSLPLL